MVELSFSYLELVFRWGRVIKGKMKTFLFIALLLWSISACHCQRISIEDLQAKAAAGDADSQALLAGRHENGTGIPQDFAKSFYWNSRAAAQTNLTGELGIQNAFLMGHGVARNDALADALAIKLANEGHIRSYRSAGLALQNRGMRSTEWQITEPTFAYESRNRPRLQTNFIQAYKWFSLACAAGDAEAFASRDEVLNMMTPESIKYSQALSASFKPVARTALQFDASGRLIYPPPGITQQTNSQYIQRMKLAAAEKRQRQAEALLAWQRQQATNGVPRSQFDLGLRYLNADGVETNPQLGAYWAKQAAAQDYTPAVDFLKTNRVGGSPHP